MSFEGDSARLERLEQTVEVLTESLLRVLPKSQNNSDALTALICAIVEMQVSQQRQINCLFALVPNGSPELKAEQERDEFQNKQLMQTIAALKRSLPLLPLISPPGETPG